MVGTTWAKIKDRLSHYRTALTFGLTFVATYVILALSLPALGK